MFIYLRNSVVCLSYLRCTNHLTATHVRPAPYHDTPCTDALHLHVRPHHVLPPITARMLLIIHHYMLIQLNYALTCTVIKVYE